MCFQHNAEGIIPQGEPKRIGYSVPVPNKTTWKKGFDADEPDRSHSHGIKKEGVYTSVENPNDVTMIFEASDVDVSEAFMSNPDLEKAMQEAGVISEPKNRG